ncbi:hypothetical protein V6N13_098939 [Hibiscus sabdariffa]|uniref:Uncharacterized protein n=1 Tax=Hibiscus sabdariffa TaxID=183260 RepID=A0ABR2P957_9ROSI
MSPSQQLYLVLGLGFTRESPLEKKSLSLSVPDHIPVRPQKRKSQCILLSRRSLEWECSVGRSTLWQDESPRQTNPPPKGIVLCPPIPIERKSCLVIPRLQHVRSLTPPTAAAVSRTGRHLTCTDTYVV